MTVGVPCYHSPPTCLPTRPPAPTQPPTHSHAHPDAHPTIHPTTQTPNHARTVFSASNARSATPPCAISTAYFQVTPDGASPPCNKWWMSRLGRPTL